MKRLLTRRKEAWVGRWKKRVIAGAPLNLPTVLEVKYANQLQIMVRRMCMEVEEELKALFAQPVAREYFDQAQDASVTDAARRITNTLMKKYNELFAKAAPDIAERQVNAVDKASSTAVHMSLSQMSGGLSLPTTAITPAMMEILNASVIENVSLIRSISIEYLGGVQQAVMRSITTGNGLQDLVPYLQKHRGITERRARNIAIDQTRKAYNNLNRGRLIKLGLKKYRWLHTNGSAKPRHLHKYVLNGQIYSFDDPPVIDQNTKERGIPGQLPYCGCKMQPVIDFGE